MRRAPGLAAAVLVALLASSCGSGGDGDGGGGAATTVDAPTSTAGDDPTTTSASDGRASTTNPAAFSPPTEPTCIAGARDGGDDTTPVAVAGAEPAAVEILADVDGLFLVLYGADAMGLTPISGPAEAGGPPARIASVVDLDGDGTDEVWVQASTGASVLIYDLYRVDGCLLLPVGLGGAPASFAVGGTVGTQVGAFCTDSGAVVAVVATSDDGERYVGERTDFRLQGGELVVEQRAPLELLASDPDFPDLAAFRC
ncbi:MAG: hypothetical protein H0W25_10730 [Acidimicrobiia bacterium]|nr:hypothetical protein [Acidimicrobiia bacterium]